MRNPQGAAIDNDGNIVIADAENNRIEFFSPAGVWQRTIGKIGKGDGQIYGPVGVAVDQVGNIIVAELGNHRIQFFSPSGESIRKIGSQGSEEGQLFYPCGIAVDSNNKIVIADQRNHRIQIFSTDGTFLQELGSHGVQDGQLDNPYGIAIDKNGNMLVTDSSNHRIVLYRGAQVEARCDEYEVSRQEHINNKLREQKNLELQELGRQAEYINQKISKLKLLIENMDKLQLEYRSSYSLILSYLINEPFDAKKI